jgi:hypothetical protein
VPVPGAQVALTAGTTVTLTPPIAPKVQQGWSVELDNVSAFPLVVTVGGQQYQLAPGVANLFHAPSGPASVVIAPQTPINGTVPSGSPGYVIPTWAVDPEQIPGTFPSSTAMQVSAGSLTLAPGSSVTVANASLTTLQYQPAPIISSAPVSQTGSLPANADATANIVGFPGAAAGDLGIIWGFSAAGTGYVDTPPAGWSLLLNSTGASAQCTFLLHKLLTAADLTATAALVLNGSSSPGNTLVESFAVRNVVIGNNTLAGARALGSGATSGSTVYTMTGVTTPGASVVLGIAAAGNELPVFNTGFPLYSGQVAGQPFYRAVGALAESSGVVPSFNVNFPGAPTGGLFLFDLVPQ